MVTLKANIFVFCLIGIILLFSQVECVIPPYIPVLGNDHLEQSDLIKRYRALGFSYKEVLLFLMVHHGIRLSLRHLKRLIENIGIKRRKNVSKLGDVIGAISEELNRSGDMARYRQMTRRLQLVKYGVACWSS